MSSSSVYTSQIWLVYNDGKVYGDPSSAAMVVYPVVNLKPSVKITGGTSIFD